MSKFDMRQECRTNILKHAHFRFSELYC